MATENVNVIVSAQDKATPVLQSIQKNASGIFGGISASAVALAGTIAGFAAGLYSVVQAASESQKEMAVVDGILKTLNGSFDENQRLVNEAAAAAAKLGFDDEEAAKATAVLYQRTGDWNETLKLNALAMDLARAKNIDLTTASNAVGAVLSGNTKILKQFGITVDETKKPMDMLAEMQTKVAGQADGFSKTFAGQMEILSVNWGNFKELVGAPMIQILTDVIMKFNDMATLYIPILESKVQSLTMWLKENKDIFDFLGKIIGGTFRFAIESVRVIFESLNITLKAVKQTFDDIGKAIDFVVQKAASAVQSVTGVTNSIGSKFNLGNYFSQGGVVPQYLAVGGYARGTDTVPAMLTPGEIVLNAAQQKNVASKMGSITININGPVSSRDVAEEYGNLIIKQLQFHAKAV